MILINSALIPLRNRAKTSSKAIVCVFVRNSTSRCSDNDCPQPVFITKAGENPVIVLSETDDVDLIGPPDALSNLRPIIRKALLHETNLQRALRDLQDKTHTWNQHFWATHNTNFIKKRQEYIDEMQVSGQEPRQLSADEMSAFYKNFLDKNWQLHVNYNVEWYRRNFALLILAFRVNLEKGLVKLKSYI